MSTDGLKFREQFLRKITQGTLLWNYYKIWPTVSEKRIFQEFLQCKKPHSPEPCLWTDQNFTNIEKGHPRNIPEKLFQNQTSGFREEDFLRISLCPYSARSPLSPEPCLWMDQNFRNNFWKGSPKQHSWIIISKSDLQFQWKRLLKNCLKNSILLLWQQEFLMELNSVNKY